MKNKNKNKFNDIKKEWNDLGYEFELLSDCCINDFQILIIFNGSNKWTFYTDFTYAAKCDEVGMREHELLTSTLIALEFFYV